MRDNKHFETYGLTITENKVSAFRVAHIHGKNVFIIHIHCDCGECFNQYFYLILDLPFSATYN